MRVGLWTEARVVYVRERECVRVGAGGSGGREERDEGRGESGDSGGGGSREEEG